MSDRLKQEGFRFIVVFDSHPPTLTFRNTPFKLYYGQRGLEVLLLSEFETLSANWTSVASIPDALFAEAV